MRLALIPAYNEEPTIAKVIVGCQDFVDKVLVCDDGSSDMTAKIAEKLGAEVIRHRSNQGKGAAMRSLFIRASELKPDSVVTIDADGQHDPSDIPKLIDGLKDSEMVIGERAGITPIRTAGNLVLQGFSKTDTQSGLRAYRGYVLPMLIPSEEGMAADSETYGQAKAGDLKIGVVKVKADYSVQNPSKVNLFFHFSDVLTNSFKAKSFRHPLSFFALPGLLIILSSVYLGWEARQYLLTAGLGSVILFLIGGFLTSMGMLVWYMTGLMRRMKG